MSTNTQKETMVTRKFFNDAVEDAYRAIGCADDEIDEETRKVVKVLGMIKEKLLKEISRAVPRALGKNDEMTGLCDNVDRALADGYSLVGTAFNLQPDTFERLKGQIDEQRRVFADKIQSGFDLERSGFDLVEGSDYMMNIERALHQFLIYIFSHIANFYKNRNYRVCDKCEKIHGPDKKLKNNVKTLDQFLNQALGKILDTVQKFQKAGKPIYYADLISSFSEFLEKKRSNVRMYYNPKGENLQIIREFFNDLKGSVDTCDETDFLSMDIPREFSGYRLNTRAFLRSKVLEGMRLYELKQGGQKLIPSVVDRPVQKEEISGTCAKPRFAALGALMPDKEIGVNVMIMPQGSTFDDVCQPVVENAFNTCETSREQNVSSTAGLSPAMIYVPQISFVATGEQESHLPQGNNDTQAAQSAMSETQDIHREGVDDQQLQGDLPSASPATDVTVTSQFSTTLTATTLEVLANLPSVPVLNAEQTNPPVSQASSRPSRPILESGRPSKLVIVDDVRIKACLTWVEQLPDSQKMSYVRYEIKALAQILGRRDQYPKSLVTYAVLKLEAIQEKMFAEKGSFALRFTDEDLTTTYTQIFGQIGFVTPVVTPHAVILQNRLNEFDLTISQLEDSYHMDLAQYRLFGDTAREAIRQLGQEKEELLKEQEAKGALRAEKRALLPELLRTERFAQMKEVNSEAGLLKERLVVIEERLKNISDEIQSYRLVLQQQRQLVEKMNETRVRLGAVVERKNRFIEGARKLLRDHQQSSA